MVRIIYVSIFRFCFLNLRREADCNKEKAAFSGQKDYDINILSSIMGRYNVHNYLKGSAKSCNTTSCLKCPQISYPKHITPQNTSCGADTKEERLGNTHQRHLSQSMNGYRDEHACFYSLLTVDYLIVGKSFNIFHGQFTTL